MRTQRPKADPAAIKASRSRLMEKAIAEFYFAQQTPERELLDHIEREDPEGFLPPIGRAGATW